MTDDAPDPGFSPQLSCEAMLRLILRQCCDQIDQQMVVFFETEALSGPHKLRVALRRLTTALDAFQPILRRKAMARVRSEAKQIFRALGEVRDADVFLLSAQKQDQQGEAETAEREALQRETLLLREHIRRNLRQQGAVALAPALLKRISGDRLFKRSDLGRKARQAPVGHMARQTLEALWIVALSQGDDLAGQSPEARHEFRKDMKSLRYLAEFFAPFWPPENWSSYRATLQALQNELGLLNDLQNAKARGRMGSARAETEAMVKANGLWAVLRDQPQFWTLPFVAEAEQAEVAATDDPSGPELEPEPESSSA